MLAQLIEKLPKACFVPDAEFSRELGLVGQVEPEAKFAPWRLCSECKLPLPAHPISEGGVCPDCFFGGPG